jgi:hypothetical protein
MPERHDDDLGPAVADIKPPGEGAKFDPGPSRELTRQILAIGVLVLVFACLATLAVPVVAGHRTWDEMEGLASTVLPSVFGIAGSVLAFYFATERGSR